MRKAKIAAVLDIDFHGANFNRRDDQQSSNTDPVVSPLDGLELEPPLLANENTPLENGRVSQDPGEQTERKKTSSDLVPAAIKDVDIPETERQSGENGQKGLGPGNSVEREPDEEGNDNRSDDDNGSGSELKEAEELPADSIDRSASPSSEVPQSTGKKSGRGYIWSDEHKDELVRLKEEEKLGWGEIALRLRRSKASVQSQYYILRPVAEVPKPNPDELHNPKYTTEEDTKLIDLVEVENLTYLEIEREMAPRNAGSLRARYAKLQSKGIAKGPIRSRTGFTRERALEIVHWKEVEKLNWDQIHEKVPGITRQRLIWMYNSWKVNGLPGKLQSIWTREANWNLAELRLSGHTWEQIADMRFPGISPRRLTAQFKRLPAEFVEEVSKALEAKKKDNPSTSPAPSSPSSLAAGSVTGEKPKGEAGTSLDESDDDQAKKGDSAAIEEESPFSIAQSSDEQSATGIGSDGDQNCFS